MDLFTAVLLRQGLIDVRYFDHSDKKLTNLDGLSKMSGGLWD